MRLSLLPVARLLGSAALCACAALPAFAQPNAQPTVILTTAPRWVSEAPTHPYRYDYELHASSEVCARSKFHCRFIPLNSMSRARLALDARRRKGDVLLIGDRAEALNDGATAQSFVKAWEGAQASGQINRFKKEYAK